MARKKNLIQLFSHKKSLSEKVVNATCFSSQITLIYWCLSFTSCLLSSRVAGVLKDERSGSDCVSFEIEWSFKTDLWNCWLTKSLWAQFAYETSKKRAENRVKFSSALMFEMLEIQRSCFRQKPHMMWIRRNISFRISQMRHSKQSFKIESSRTHPPDGRENLGNLWASMRWISW